MSSFLSFFSPEGEVDGPSADDRPGGAGHPAPSQDEPCAAPAEAETGAGQDGGHAQGQDSQETGQAGAGAQTHPGGRTTR